jgi:hypothetical protein
MREPLGHDIRDSYERPNQRWVCGLADEGPPCPLGPTGSGACSHGMACHPKRDGDRWICNRAPLRGGVCEAGPSPEGECCFQYTCTPARSLRSQRGRFVWAVSLATLGGMCLVLSSSERNDFLAPGPLSVHHAQLVARGDDQTKRCASCHAAGNQSFVEWISHATDATVAAPAQSELCLNCHDKEIPRDTALLAHGVADSTLFAGHEHNTGGRRVDPHGSFGCSTCHREHHGASFDLKAMSNSACQACHREQYRNFATDHPEFKNWPERRRTRIAFDHTAHQAKHFPAQKQEFACSQCHQLLANGFQKTLGFQVSCSQCHESDIQTSWKLGIDFVSLPMIDTEALADAGHKVDRWPGGATGDFDGSLPLLTKLLLLSDDETAESLEHLGIDFDFFDIDPGNAGQLAAAAMILSELTEFIAELANKGHDAIKERLARATGREPTSAELAAAAAHLSPENLAAASEKWLADAGTDLTGSEPESLVTAGGWIRDDRTYSLRYLPSGHDDPFTTAWINLLATATRGPQPKLAEKLLTEMMKPTAPGTCGSCHSIDRAPAGGLMVNWHAKQHSSERHFTVFSHSPHVLQTQLADCTACHPFAEAAHVMATYTQTNPSEFAAGFHALTRQDCAGCHKPDAAGDDCTQCHRYHVRLLPKP